jgi:methionyl-tRNA formyltransferase
MAPLRIIFAGSGEFGLPTLKALLAAGHELVQVVSQPDRPAGRGRGLTPTPIAEFATAGKLPLLRTENINRETLPEADVMVVIAFGQKLADSVVQRPRLGSVNLHASRLPKYRGAAPINWAILNGETVTGNSVIRLAQRMDAGAILGQSELTIGELETAGELHDRLAEDGARLLPEVLKQLEEGRAHEIEQDDSRATMAPKLTRETAQLDWHRPAAELARRVRGLYPWPGCRVALRDAEGTEVARLRLVRARPSSENEGSRWTPGEIVTSGSVQTGNGCLEIVECQPDGKRPMPLADYRRGHRWQAGLRLESVL